MTVVRKKKKNVLSNLQAKLVLRIVELAKEQEFAKGHHLIEEALAEEFGVSRSPIRFALTYLADHDLVEFRPNHGFFLQDSAKRLDVSALRLPEADDEKLYAQITGDRVNGKLPDAQTESQLMRKYRVSRGLLRRVLMRLLQDGIVLRGAGYGWVFLPTINSDEVHSESYRFRITIETAGFAEPTFKLDEKRLATARTMHERVLKTGGRKLTPSQMYEMNAGFHEMLASFSGNRFLLQAIEQQNNLRRLMENQRISPGRFVESCEEHLGIMAALSANDREWAAALLRRHLETSSKLRWADDPAKDE